MSRKDFDDYFAKVSHQYLELREALKEISEEVDKKLVEPERLEQLKATLQPVVNSYNTLNYIRYLLDMPNRKSKKEKYNKQCKKIIQSTKEVSKEAVIENNNNVLSSLKL